MNNVCKEKQPINMQCQILMEKLNYSNQGLSVIFEVSTACANAKVRAKFTATPQDQTFSINKLSLQ